MNATQTTLESYFKLRQERKLGKMQETVYRFISFNPKCCDREIMLGTKLSINCVCGRRNELVKLGYVKNEGVKFDKNTERNVMVWCVS